MASSLGNLVHRYGAPPATLVWLLTAAIGGPVLAVVLDVTTAPTTPRLAAQACGLLVAVGAAVALGIARTHRVDLFQQGLVYRGRAVRWDEIDTVRYGSGRVGEKAPERVTIEMENGDVIVIPRRGAKELGQHIQRSIGTRVTR